MSRSTTRMSMRIFCQTMFQQRSTTWLPSSPSSYSVSPSRSASGPMHLTCSFYPLSEQFSKYANLFFLFTACIQQIPGVSPTNKWTTIAPLSVVLLASAFKEVQEDLVSHVITSVSLSIHTSCLETPSIGYRPQFSSREGAHSGRFFQLYKVEGYQSR